MVLEGDNNWGGSGRTLLTERVFDAGGIPIHYAESAPHGQPLVLLHGIARDWRDFLSLIPGFPNSHLFSLDLRGHGHSGRRATGYRTGDYASDVIAFLHEIVQAPAVILGHSLGGIIAMRIAAEHPELVRAIIVGDSVFSRETLAHSMYQSLFVGLHRIVVQGGTAHDMAERLRRLEIVIPGLPEPIPIGDLPGNDPASLRKWAECLVRLDPVAIEATISGKTFEDFEWSEILPRIQCPVLLLQANPELGGLMSDEAIVTFQRSVTQVRVARFKVLGHALHLQRAQPVIEAVQAFMGSI